MSVLSVLYDVIILPIEAVIEFVFCYIYTRYSFLGVLGAIIAVSVAVNFLTLPLYLKADAIQLKERKLQNKMADRIMRIKKAFHGDEQFMMLSEYYRQNDYHPLYAMRSALSILIEIPFFIAAYHFLSNCTLLEGVSIYGIPDLSRPDGLITIGNTTINILPILMTLTNLISAFIYTRKDTPLKEKLQIYILALIFLLLLYHSPSGLVIYWIMNNVFSLVKNIVMSCKKPFMVFYGIICMAFVCVSLYVSLYMPIVTLRRKVILWSASFGLILLPLILKLVVNRFSFPCRKHRAAYGKNKRMLFLLSCIIMWVVGGLLLPSSVIVTSVREFTSLGSIDNPLTYVFSSGIFFAGFFIFWPVCIYFMFQDRLKNILPVIFCIASYCSVLNAYVFKSDYGYLTTAFEPEQAEKFISSSLTAPMILLPLLAAVLLLLVYWWVERRNRSEILLMVSIIIIVSGLVMTGRNIMVINDDYQEYHAYLAENRNDKIKPEINLTATGKNVLILFNDRMGGWCLPYVLEQFPEIATSFEGFTYYPNCMSFGSYTKIGAPAMMGGYEYTPDKINGRGQPLVETHNESMLVLPRNFLEAGWDVTVTDPPYSNYVLRGDYSPFESYEEIDVKSLLNKYAVQYIEENKILTYDSGSLAKKHCRIFSLVQMIYPPLRKMISGSGSYRTVENFEIMRKIDDSVYGNYALLKYLPDITTDDAVNDTFHFCTFELTHCLPLLLEPDYHLGVPSDSNPIAGFGAFPEGNDYGYRMQYCHAQIATTYLLAEYFEYLKTEGLYDNTRIIIVSDHGYHFDTDEENTDIPTEFNPILMVKDFNAQGTVKTDKKLCTNADVPYIATNGLNMQASNPFTGNPYTCSDDYEKFEAYYTEDIERVDLGEDWSMKWSKKIKYFDITKSYFIKKSGDAIIVETGNE